MVAHPGMLVFALTLTFVSHLLPLTICLGLGYRVEDVQVWGLEFRV